MRDSVKVCLQQACYNTIWLVLALPFLIYLRWRYRHYPGHNQAIWQRLGFAKADQTTQPSYWFHLASVGEVNVGLIVINRLLQTQPLSKFLVTTNTPTGAAVLKEALGETLNHCYLPFDIPWVIRRFLTKHNIQCLVLFETEIWPNVIRECHGQSIPIVLANARLSESSKRKYVRYPELTRSILAKIQLIAAQSQADANRFAELGAQSLSVTGNIKLDQKIDQGLLAEAKAYRVKLQASDNRKVILAASMHPGEIPLILNSYVNIKRDFPNTLLILVPRHLDSLEQFEQASIEQKLSVRRKSRAEVTTVGGDILLVDTMGELLMLCGCSDIVIMGGTFIEHGGHNFLEPAAWGVPILSGDSDYNFKFIAQGLKECGGLIQVADSQSLSQRLQQLLASNSESQRRGNAAREFVEQNRGALEQLLKLIVPKFLH